jgi:hypothetical protein
MNKNAVAVDERTIAVTHASNSVALSVISFGLLLDATYRSWVLHQNVWDLLALVILGGVVAIIMRAKQRVLPYFPHRFWWVMIATALFSAAFAAILAYFMGRH